jgi:hypothetical protein
MKGGNNWGVPSPVKRFHRGYISPSITWGYRNIGVPIVRNVLPYAGEKIFNYGIRPAYNMGRRYIMNPVANYIGDRANAFHNYMMEDELDSSQRKKRILSMLSSPKKQRATSRPMSILQKLHTQQAPPDPALLRELEMQTGMAPDLGALKDAETEALLNAMQKQGFVSPGRKQRILAGLERAPSVGQMISLLTSTPRMSKKRGSPRTSASRGSKRKPT